MGIEGTALVGQLQVASARRVLLELGPGRADAAEALTGSFLSRGQHERSLECFDGLAVQMVPEPARPPLEEDVEFPTRAAFHPS
jgi:hypothetical protein